MIDPLKFSRMYASETDDIDMEKRGILGALKRNYSLINSFKKTFLCCFLVFFVDNLDG